MSVGHYTKQHKKKLNEKNAFNIIAIDQHSIVHSVCPIKKMKLFNKEFKIPDIDKNAEKLSLAEKKAFDKSIEKNKEIHNAKSAVVLSDTISVDLKEFNAKNNELIYYGFNNQTKEFGTITYFDSDPLLEDQNLREQYFEAQPLKFDVYKGYYPNGNIKMKRLSFSAVIIKQYEYDKNGNLVKSFDLSKNYKLSVTDVLKILEKNNIGLNFKIDRLSASPSTYLYCLETNRGKIWHLEQYQDEKEFLIFDHTGELLSQKSYSNEKGSFVILSRATYEMRYKNKTIEEVERETGNKLFVVN